MMEKNCVSDGLCENKNPKMSRKVQMLRSLVEQRLSAAAEEIFGLVERTMVEYEEELCQTKEENQRQKQILDSVLNPQVVAHPPDVQHLPVFKEDIPFDQEEDWTSPSVDPDPEPSLMKEEQEEMKINDTEQLIPLSEFASTAAFPESHPSGLDSPQSQNAFMFLDPESPCGKHQKMNTEGLQLVESVLTTKPGGERIINEHDETQTLLDVSRTKMVKTLTADMAEKNRTSPSREVKDMCTKGITTLPPSLRDPLSKNGYVSPSTHEAVAQTGQPVKARAQKRLKSFKDKSMDWAKSMRRNRNVSHFLDNIEVTIEKMKALGLRPFLLYSIYDDKSDTYESRVICPYDCDQATKKMIEKIEQLYQLLLQVWTPQDEQSRRKEKRKGKRRRMELLGEERSPTSGNQGPTSGEEGAAVPDRGECEPPVSVTQQLKNLVNPKAKRRTSGGETQDGEEEGYVTVEDSTEPVDVEDGREEGSAGPGVKEMKIFFKKRRQWSRECSLHPYAESFQACKLGKRQKKKGVDLVLVYWKTCEECGEEWRPSWEPAHHMEYRP
ncbi:uncharacterized protein LOC115427883 [Sphaeramia orbicularis]|uniref:uncharacterized protein LOC115427883 n=1 Tax=Sphaeramia orbicularis TaxID=375764 RepID=UPI00117FC551|nr:uncharacterized protein LOC115427883 [Sphaeramia orbicularis]